MTSGQFGLNDEAARDIHIPLIIYGTNEPDVVLVGHLCCSGIFQ